MEQRIAVLVSAVFGLLLLAVFVNVARSATSAGSSDEVALAAAKWRRTTLWALIIVFIPVIGYSLTRMPYARSTTPAAVAINAAGTQWSWAMSADTVATGQPVDFMVSGADVNHGFGLYNPDGRLIAQTQAMPGYTNTLRHTFTTPGTYRILCLEYCGLGHHTMLAQLVVTAGQ